MGCATSVVTGLVAALRWCTRTSCYGVASRSLLGGLAADSEPGVGRSRGPLVPVENSAVGILDAFSGDAEQHGERCEALER